MMKSIALVALLGLASSQYHPACVYRAGPGGNYTLNLTSISGWPLEYESSSDGHFYYYTPCTNNEVCYQGNAEFRANAVQYNPGSNTCNHYLAVDHHENPDYIFSSAAWHFRYTDGELCDQTQAPRSLDTYYICDEALSSTRFYDAYEPYVCQYTFVIRSPLACVAENQYNAKCQWRHYDYTTNTSYYLDLSSENGTFYHGVETSNGYEVYYSPCQNAIPCYQQSGQSYKMSIVENRVTRTCDRYLAEWQEGRVQPVYHDSTTADDQHWSFHYYLSEKCNNGEPGEETIRWFCDSAGGNTTVLNATYDGDCRWEFNLRSPKACPGSAMYKPVKFM